MGCRRLQLPLAPTVVSCVTLPATSCRTRGLAKFVGRPATVPLTMLACGGTIVSAQLTEMVSTLALAVPVPLATVQVCAAGCAITRRLYAVPAGRVTAYGPLTVRLALCTVAPAASTWAST